MEKNQPRVKSSCDACQNAKVRCSKSKPTCTRCSRHGRLCVYSVSRRLGRPRQRSNSSSVIQRASSPNSSSNLTHDNALRSPGSDFEWTSMDTFIADANAHEHNVDDMMLADCLMSESDINENLGGTAYLDGLMSDFIFQCYDSGISPHLPLSSTSDPQLMLKDKTQVESTTTMSHGASHSQALESAAFENSPTQQNERSTRSNLPKDDQILPPPPGYTTTHCNGPIYSDIPRYQSRRCACYGSILRRLSDLHAHEKRIPAVEVDAVMGLEKVIRQQIASVIECKACSGNRTRLLLLATIMFGSIVTLLGKLLDCEVIPRSSFDVNKGSTETVHSPPQYPSNSCTMHVGGYEIFGEERTEVLKHLILKKLHGLTNLVFQFQVCVQQSGGNQCFTPATTLIADIQRQLDNLIDELTC